MSNAPQTESRSRVVRPVSLLLGILGVLGVTGFILYRSGQIGRWLATDTDNIGELTRLREKPPSIVPVAEAGSGWPQWMGPLRDGRAPAGPFRTNWDVKPPQELWSVPLGGGYSSMAVVDGRVYTQDRQEENERVVCLDGATGSLLWSHSYPVSYAGTDRNYATGPRATPTVEGNRVYTVGGAGKLLCLESPAQGVSPRIVWEHELVGPSGQGLPRWGVAGSPLIDGDQVVAMPGGDDASVAAFDKMTGAIRWKAGSNPTGYSSPVATTLHGVRLIFAFTGNMLLCLRADGLTMGTYKWETDHRANIATPLILGEYVFITSAYGKGCALLRVEPDGDRVKLEVVYSRGNKPLRCHHSTPVALGTHLYGFDGDRDNAILSCLNYLDGTAVEDWGSRKIKNGKIILANRHLIVLSEDGRLHLVKAVPDALDIVASIETGFTGDQNWALPVLLDGRLYVRGAEKLVCYDVKP